MSEDERAWVTELVKTLQAIPVSEKQHLHAAVRAAELELELWSLIAGSKGEWGEKHFKCHQERMTHMNAFRDAAERIKHLNAAVKEAFGRRQHGQNKGDI